MTSCRHHSGYLADDEAGPTPYVPRVQPPKKPLFPEMGPASKVGHMPHPPSMHSPVSSSGLRGHCRNLKGSRPFRNFLDFLVEGQVLDSLQTVVEVATERMATMKTGAGLPLVEMQDPVEVPKVGRRACSRPSLSTVHRHRTRPSLCVGHPNNYPSCSSSMSDSHSSFRACWPGSQCRDSDLDAHSLGPLPAVKDRLLLEKSLKQLLQLENRGKGLGQCCSHRDSLPWDSLDSQASSQWTPETPLSWFSGLLGSSSGTLEASELGPGEQELVFLKREFNKQIKSLLSQPVAFDLPGYCAIREPHRTLDFLAEHHLFPALQNVVNQAVDKLSGACRHNGRPLFPSEWEPTTESNSKLATPTNGEEPDNLLPTTASSPKVDHRKNVKPKGRSKPKGGGSPVSSTQVDTRFRLEMTPTEEPKVPSPHLRHEVSDRDPKVQRPPTPASGPPSSSQRSRPWRSLHLTLPGPGVVLEVPSRQTHLPTLGSASFTSPCPSSSYHLPAFSPYTSAVWGLSPSPATLCPESPSYMFPKKKPLPSILSKSSSVSHLSNPWQEELVSYLKDQAVSLLIYKHKFEKNLTGQLGFISFPVTEALMDLFLGFKRVKGSCIHLSSKINWSCLLRRLEEAQSSQQVSQRATRWVSRPASQETSQHNTPQRSPETPTVQPELATRATKVQDKPTEPHLDIGLLLTPQENAVDAGQETSGFPEPKVSTSADTSVASHLSKQKVDKKDKQSIEEEVEEEELEDAEEEEEEEEEVEEEEVEEEVEEVEEEVEEDDFFGDKDEPQSSPESPLEATGSPSADSIVGPSDSP